MEASPMGAVGDPVRLKKEVNPVLLPKKLLHKHTPQNIKGIPRSPAEMAIEICLPFSNSLHPHNVKKNNLKYSQQSP
jgi:hypothetical protein